MAGSFSCTFLGLTARTSPQASKMRGSVAHVEAAEARGVIPACCGVFTVVVPRRDIVEIGGVMRCGIRVNQWCGKAGVAAFRLQDECPGAHEQRRCEAG